MNRKITGHSDLLPNRKPGDPKFVDHPIPDKKGRRIFDVTMFSGEAAMLYTRLWRYYDYVDQFVIGILPRTFTNIPTNYSFWPFEEELKQFMDKVLIIREIPEDRIYKNLDSHKSFSYEHSWRVYFLEVIRQKFHPKNGDLIFASDLDEIITREGIEYLINHWPTQQIHPLTRHSQPNFLYDQGDWCCPVIFPYSDNMPDLLTLRKRVHITPITREVVATHCSWCFTHLENYTRKKNAYSHQEKNFWPKNDDSYTFRYHWCRFWDDWKMNFIKPGLAHTGTTLKNLLPDHPHLKYLTSPYYMLDITKTIWEYEDLDTMCTSNFPSREEWEKKAKAKGIYVIRTPLPVTEEAIFKKN
ncbi:hypothetical protein TVAG_157000 [Trichomonas vaginalis G3]|uniref:Glycosyltransferase family 17 protein n=1 Tax=Trichomonas vaginalis (strain ATCC PRA-98 / G3) TaxID=412133 RepID=A2FM37_TRIV3|nr:beta-1,4-mannosyl-glycoprotein beta-1,4-n-acetylglucosaminyl-transferase family [Trichomonas vaginalis G3]EAX94039.1 hypothetical protein TVAG_157000 [Trichomonas vaginalis G3]KAI5494522.1 beta-1,4-mannosyl-glycoprotein beta-1,4-n-acetylglucosaminyl-transferase family [Trichomonas vaginalis G3]|eukprot:XP_001306969.1 hypothetical protein [Trichomonas vaginalis G3]